MSSYSTFKDDSGFTLPLDPTKNAVPNTWSNVSFTPDRQPPILLRDVTVTFPAADNIHDTTATDDPEESIGPTGIRITASKAGDIPTFQEGTTGVFKGTRYKSVVFYAVNAKVDTSNPGWLVLAAESIDECTNPVSVTRTDDPEEQGDNLDDGN